MEVKYSNIIKSEIFALAKIYSYFIFEILIFEMSNLSFHLIHIFDLPMPV